MIYFIGNKLHTLKYSKL